MGDVDDVSADMADGCSVSGSWRRVMSYRLTLFALSAVFATSKLRALWGRARTVPACLWFLASMTLMDVTMVDT